MRQTVNLPAYRDRLHLGRHNRQEACRHVVAEIPSGGNSDIEKQRGQVSRTWRPWGALKFQFTAPAGTEAVTHSGPNTDKM